MGIAYKEIRRLVRFKARDNNEIIFSDYDIKEALNECIRYFNISYSLKNSDFLEKIIILDQDEMNAEITAKNEELADADKLPLYDFRLTGVELPNDFLSLQGLTLGDTPEMMHPTEAIRIPMDDEYKVTGDRLYLGHPRVRMVYKAAIPEISGEEDIVPLPFVFKDTLAKITYMILENDANKDVLMEAINDAAANLTPTRRYTNARGKMPFYA